jgi:hypothetical protein
MAHALLLCIARAVAQVMVVFCAAREEYLWAFVFFIPMPGLLILVIEGIESR